MAKILTIDGKDIKPLDKVKFNLESDLQGYLEQYPAIIPLDEIVEDVPELICIGREVVVPSGSIDLMYIDKEGLLTIVETKLVKNPEIRRTVIGQLIEYASFVSQWTVSEIYNIASSYLKQTLKEKIASYSGSEFNEDDFKHNIEDNLKNGKIRLIVAVDELNEPLRATITFLNTHSNFDVLLLQISSFEESEDKRVLIPTVFGYSSKTGKTSSRKRWDPDRFFNDVNKRLQLDITEAINELYEFTKDNADNVYWGTGASTGSFTFHKIYRDLPLSIFSVYSDGYLYLNFGYMKDKEIDDQFLESFRDMLNDIPQMRIPEDITKGRKFPGIKIELLTQPESMDKFQKAVLKLSKEIDKLKEQ